MGSGNPLPVMRYNTRQGEQRAESSAETILTVTRRKRPDLA